MSSEDEKRAFLICVRLVNKLENMKINLILFYGYTSEIIN